MMEYFCTECGWKGSKSEAVFVERWRLFCCPECECILEPLDINLKENKE